MAGGLRSPTCYKARRRRRYHYRSGNSDLKTVMEGVHGPDWYAQLKAQNRDVAEAGGSDLASQISGESAEGRKEADGDLDVAGLRDKGLQDGGEDTPAGTTGPEGQSVAGASRSIASEGPVRAAEVRKKLRTGIDLGVMRQRAILWLRSTGSHWPLKTWASRSPAQSWLNLPAKVSTQHCFKDWLLTARSRC